MLNYNQFVILSAELSHLTPKENEIRTNQLQLMLTKLGFKPTEMIGRYKGDQETSFFVPITRNDDIERLEFIAFDRFGQESILVQYSDGHSRLHYPNHIEHIGKVREITKQEAFKRDAYTFYPKLNKYYATV
jgi:hypothetical protein